MVSFETCAATCALRESTNATPVVMIIAPFVCYATGRFRACPFMGVNLGAADVRLCEAPHS